MNINVIRLAREAGAYETEDALGDAIVLFDLAELERFAVLVAAEVMEEDAKVCEKVGNHNITAACASAIRARKPA